MKVLIVDDEIDILDLLEYNLIKEGYEVCRAMDGKEAIQVAQKERPNLILLDIMMPRMNGIEACEKLREMPDMQGVYIVFLTARSEEYSELAGFEVGADDYISKPIKPRILKSRIKAILRRNQQQKEESSILRIHDLEINRDEYHVKKGDQVMTLPKKEFELLSFLASHPGKVFSREILLKKVWQGVFVVDRTVDVHIRKLREKIGNEYILTIKGVGYKFLGKNP